MMKQKKRLLTDAFLAVATIGMAAGMAWAEDGGVTCPERIEHGFTIPAFKCPAGSRCVYMVAFDKNGDPVGAAGGCMGTPPD